MSIVGITGGIGSGKSVVSRLLRLLNYPVYDSDVHAKQLYVTDQLLLQQLRDSFGSQIFDGSVLNRAKLAEIVFADANKLQQLNALVHPAVFRDFHNWLNLQNNNIVFVESAILLQTDFARQVSHVIVVTSPMSVRMARIVERDHCTVEQAQARILSQMSDEEMLHHAHFSIQNDENHVLIAQLLDILYQLSSKK